MLTTSRWKRHLTGGRGKKYPELESATVYTNSFSNGNPKLQTVGKQRGGTRQLFLITLSQAGTAHIKALQV